MKSLTLPTLLGSWLLLLAAPPVLADSFVAPADGPVVFRRDRLPLDVDTMTRLADQLAVLANGQGGDEAVKRRAVAQMLGLAFALQPGNVEALRILDKFNHGIQKAWGDSDQLTATSAEIWPLLGWLETAAAGKDSHALAACLGDVLVIADAQHPRAEALRKAGEQGAWAGWVEPLSAFEKTEKTGPVVKLQPPENQPPVLPVKKPTLGVPIMLAKAVVSTPLWTFDKATKAAVLRAMPIRMQAKMKDGMAKTEPLSCTMEFSGLSAFADTNAFKFTADTVGKALTKQHGKVPAGVSVGLVCGDDADYLMARNRSAISGAAAVLINAAITGCEPDATIIGEIQADGRFTLPARFWEKLRALSSGPGGRLVVPTEAERYLPSILALEDPDFFFKYEVLCASNLGELIARSAKESEADLAQATASFAEIRSKIGSQPVPQYIVNHFIRQRLEEVAKGASYHASARLLALQGEGKRPTQLPRNLLACQLRKAIQPMAWIPKYNIEGYYDPKLYNVQLINAKALNDAFEVCVKEVDRLGRYVEMRDRDLHTQVRDMVTTIRTLSRVTRGRSDGRTGKVPIRAEFYALARSYQAVMKVLNQTAIDESGL
ncbi:MAG: hypothetical protein WCO57_12835 [Verrucomicrobiota bacterium]